MRLLTDNAKRVMVRKSNFSVTRGTELMSYALAMDWPRCPDGVRLIEKETAESEIRRRQYRINLRPNMLSGELPDIGSPPEVETAPCFVYNTDRRELKRRTVGPMTDNDSGALVLKYVNCASPDDYIKFFSEYGMPLAADGEQVAEVEALTAAAWHALFQNMIRVSKKPEECAELINNAFTRLRSTQLRPRAAVVDGRPRLVLAPNSLFTFMLLEVCAIYAGGQSPGQCENCSKVFITGSNTGHNSRRRFCSDKCRVAFNRAEKKKAEFKAEAVTPE